MAVAIVTDSNSGITQDEGKHIGAYVLSMPFTINGEEYFEDITLSQDEFYEKLQGGADVATSQPNPDAVMGIWDEALKDHDQVVYIPMSSGLSGSCETAMMLAEDYEGRVFVVNNQRISVTQRQSVIDALMLAERGWDGRAIRDKLEEVKFDSSIYITLDTLTYLRKGGRITPAVAAMGTLLHLKPVLTIQGEKLDTYSKSRNMKIAKATMIKAISQDMDERFGDKEGEHSHIAIAHTLNEDAARELRDELMELFPKTGEIVINPLSLSVSCHIGPGALAIAVSKEID